MKRIVIPALAVFALAACAEMPTQPAPTADLLAMSMHDGATPLGAVKLLDNAFVAEGFLCGLGPAGLTTDSHVVNTPNGKNVKLVCHNWAPNPFGQTMKFTSADFGGAQCGIPGPLGGATTNFRLLWAAGGDATLTCTL